MNDHDLLRGVLILLSLYGFIRYFRNRSDGWVLCAGVAVLALAS